MKISSHAMNLLETFEGPCVTTAYVCPSGTLTIGYGHTKDVKKGDVCSPTYALTLLKQDVIYFEKNVENALNADEIVVTQGQFDALVCFAFNVGMTALIRSTLWKKLRNHDYQGASNELLRWNKADGHVLKGLTRRREAERALFLS